MELQTFLENDIEVVDFLDEFRFLRLDDGRPLGAFAGLLA